MTKPLALNSQVAYTIYQNLKEDNLCFGYQGDFTDDMTEKIIALGECNVKNVEELKKLKKRVSFLMAESFQNMIRHSDSPSIQNRAVGKMGMFLVRNIASNYYIITTNHIENVNIESVRSKLERINQLSPEELKTLQMEILSQGEMSEKGGAGLGFIEMARKSGNQLAFNFEKVNDKFSLFYLGIRLHGSAGAEVENQNIFLNIGKDLHEKIVHENILMMYKGDFSRDSILPLLKVIEDNIARHIEEFKIKKNVFFALIELLQNVSKHALSVNGTRDGIFTIGKKDRFYQITAGNLIDNSQVGLLEDKLKQINALESKELSDLYKTTLMKEEVREKGGAGVGFIDIARGSSGKMAYSFTPQGLGNTFYLLSITV